MKTSTSATAITFCPVTTEWHFSNGNHKLGALLESGNLQAELIKCNQRRSVYFVPAQTGLDRDLYLKHDHPDSLRDSIKAVWRCKARAEYRSGIALQKAGVPVVGLLGWGRNSGDGFLISEALPDVVSAATFWEAARDDPVSRTGFLRNFTAFLQTLHDAGVRHPDFHSGNVLVAGTADVPSFFLVDVYDVTVDAVLGDRECFWLINWAFGVIMTLTEDELPPVLLAAGIRMSGNDCLGALRCCVAYWTRDAYRRWPGRRRRYLRDSSLVRLVNDPRGCWRVLRTFDLEIAESAIEAHNEQIQRGGAILKRDRKRQLTRVAVADQSFVVKEYLSPGPWGVWAADCRSWLNSNRLSWYQIPAVRPFAFLHQPDGRGFLILEDVGEQTLLEVLRKEQVPGVRCKWLKAIAELLASLHRFRIEHGDLKLTNIMISTQHDSLEIPLVLIDLDAVRFGVRMTIRQRVADLAQVLESLPSGQGSEPYRLLAEYRQAARLTRAELREVRDAL